MQFGRDYGPVAGICEPLSSIMLTRDALTRSASTSTIFANRALLLGGRRSDYCKRRYIWGFTSKKRYEMGFFQL